MECIVAKKASSKAGKKAAPAKKPAKALKTIKPPPRATPKAAARVVRPTKLSKPPATAKSKAKPVLAVTPPPVPKAKQSSGLSKREVDMLRDLLLAKRAELVGDVNRMRDEALGKNRQDAAGDLSNMPIHMADLGTDNYEQEFTLNLIDTEQAILREIEDALARIESGDYGVCVATGQPIGLARLKAKPWAKYCYEYVLEQEKRRNSRY